jgi:hypothetical protein
LSAQPGLCGISIQAIANAHATRNANLIILAPSSLQRS